MRGNFLLPLATTIPIVLLMYLVSNLLTYSGVFRGHGAMPPFWPDHENFLQATLYEKVRFCHFPARIAKFNNV